MKSNKSFSERKIHKITGLFLWQDLSDSYSGYCENDKIPDLIEVLTSLQESTKKFGTATGSIDCDSTQNGNDKYANRTWYQLLKIKIDSNLPREMKGEDHTLHLTMNSIDLDEMIELIQKYSRKQIHAFPAFSVPLKISKKRESTLDLIFYYNLQGID